MTKKLSQSQIRMLCAVRDHNNPYYGIYGRSAHGGAGQTLDALQRRRLLDKDCQLTEAGREALSPN